jgi:hypothetical protein
MALQRTQRYIRSERAGQRVMKSIARFITQKLILKVNEATSGVVRPQQRKFHASTDDSSLITALKQCI